MKNLNLRHLTFLFLATLTLAACNNDDDDVNPGEEPGAVSGGSLEGDEKKKDSSALGIISIIVVMSILIGVRWYKRRN